MCVEQSQLDSLPWLFASTQGALQTSQQVWRQQPTAIPIQLDMQALQSALDALKRHPAGLKGESASLKKESASLRVESASLKANPASLTTPTLTAAPRATANTPHPTTILQSNPCSVSPLTEDAIFLSPATLVVVPAVLVDHWVNQIQTHTKPGRLRVLQLTHSNVHGLQPQQVACDYNVVITTLELLSTSSEVMTHLLLHVSWLSVV